MSQVQAPTLLKSQHYAQCANTVTLRSLTRRVRTAPNPLGDLVRGTEVKYTQAIFS